MRPRDHLTTRRPRAAAWASDDRRPAHPTAAAPRIRREEAFRPVAGAVRAKRDEGTQDRPFAALPADFAGPRLPHAARFQCHSQAGMATANPPTAGTHCHLPSATAKAHHAQG
ncbi:hypothetical protein GmRootA79_14880 [Acidovorax sp. A79]|uniref:hypothetical protein n=1 Tax=Acidovorax sp. A79 TaxID=3056107 RepID=UPI0034E87AE3